MKFQTISVIKFPPDISWNAMMHHLPAAAKDVDDLESIIETERKIISDDLVKIVNEWRAKPKLPSVVLKYIKPDMLAWTDTAMWHIPEKKIEWSICSRHFKENLLCEGNTLFEPAMGSKGCRISFGGNLTWNAANISLGIDLLNAAVARTAEGVLAQMIPANFRKITHVLSAYLDQTKTK